MDPEKIPRRSPLLLLVLVVTVLLSSAFTANAAVARQGADDTTKKAHVEIENLAFTPTKLHIKKGTRVLFLNKDTVPHSATGNKFDTGILSPGDSAAVRFKKVGSFAYHCTLHSFMNGRIVVR